MRSGCETSTVMSPNVYSGAPPPERSARGGTGRRRDRCADLDRHREARLDLRARRDDGRELAADAQALLPELRDEIARRFDERCAGLHPMTERLPGELEPLR